MLSSWLGTGMTDKGELSGWLGRQLGSEYGERGMQRAAAVGNDLGSKGHTVSPH